MGIRMKAPDKSRVFQFSELFVSHKLERSAVFPKKRIHKVTSGKYK